MDKKYQITPILWLAEDREGVKFHVKNEDYFGTIATILSLIKQQIKKNDSPRTAVLKKTLKNLETDLLWLQKNYQIKPRIKNRNIKPKGKLRSQ